MGEDDILDQVRSRQSGRYWALLGIETVAAERGRVVSRLQVEDHHLNANDVVHGGVISSLIDSVAGGAVRSHRGPEASSSRPHSTSDLHVSYLSAARSGELIGEGRVVKAGRTAIFTEVDVRDGAGRLIARGLATFVIGAPRSDAAPD